MDEYYLIAEVSTINSDGSVIIKPFSDFSERFSDLDKIVINFFGKPRELDIEFTDFIGDSILIKFVRFNSEEDVFFLLNKNLYIDKKNLYKLPPNMFYIHDLIGSDVYRDSLFFGKLVDIFKLPGSDVYVIENSSGKEILIPVVEEFIQKIDDKENRIELTSESKIFDEDEN